MRCVVRCLEGKGDFRLMFLQMFQSLWEYVNGEP
jgi:hypothetical protein